MFIDRNMNMWLMEKFSDLVNVDKYAYTLNSLCSLFLSCSLDNVLFRLSFNYAVFQSFEFFSLSNLFILVFEPYDHYNPEYSNLYSLAFVLSLLPCKFTHPIKIVPDADRARE